MADLILRRSGSERPEREYALQLRYHDLGGTEYIHVCYVSRKTAEQIVDAGAPYFLFGDPRVEEK